MTVRDIKDLRTAREQRGFTTEQVASALYVSRATYIKWEREPWTIPDYRVYQIKLIFPRWEGHDPSDIRDNLDLVLTQLPDSEIGKIKAYADRLLWEYKNSL